MKRSDISDLEALLACWPWGGFAEVAQHPRPGAMEILSRSYPVKVAWRKLEQLDDRRWIDYGVSINYPWRTPLGEEMLDKLFAGTSE